MNCLALDRSHIALLRGAEGCARLVNRELGQVVSLEGLLLRIAPERFERDKEALAFYQRFLSDGDLTGPDYGTTPDELRRAAWEIFRELEPLAIEGFQTNGKPNVWSYLAEAALRISQIRGAA